MPPTGKQKFRSPQPLSKTRTAIGKASTSTAVQAITKARSSQVLQSLLTTAIGSIVYLRNLFPLSDFEEWDPSRIFPDDPRQPATGSSRPEPLFPPDGTPSQSSQAKAPPFSPDENKFVAMRISPGDKASKNAKLLTNYLAGAMEALEKGYLSSLMFIIYLDEARPDDIIEAYTFNFAYAEGSDVPTMSLDQLSLAGGAFQSSSSKRYGLGTPQTEQDVRTSVKKIIKQCVIATQSLADLPDERILDFKLFYNESAPDDYQPAFFHTGSENTLTLGTNSAEEVPIYKSIGGVQTGQHGMSVKIASVVQHCEWFMPAAEAMDKYEGERPDETKLQVYERATRQGMLDDAEKRNILFDAEKLVADPSLGPLEPTEPADIQSHQLAVPFGQRLADGSVLDIGANESMLPQTQAIVLSGKRDERTGRIGRARRYADNACDSSQLDATQYTTTQPLFASGAFTMSRSDQLLPGQSHKLSQTPDIHRAAPMVDDEVPKLALRTATPPCLSLRLILSPDKTTPPQSISGKKRKSSNEDNGLETETDSSDTTMSEEFDPKRERPMSVLAAAVRKPGRKASGSSTAGAKKATKLMPLPKSIPKPKQTKRKPAAPRPRKAKPAKAKAVPTQASTRVLGKRAISPSPPSTLEQIDGTQTQTQKDYNRQRTESIQPPLSQTLPDDPAPSPPPQETMYRALKRTKTSRGIGSLITRTTIADWNADPAV